MYRLVHDELREILRYRWRELLIPSDAGGPAGGGRGGDTRCRSPHRRRAGRPGRVRPTVAAGPGGAALHPAPPGRARARRRRARRLRAAPVCCPTLDLARLRTAVGASPARRQLEEVSRGCRSFGRMTHLWDWNRPARNAAAIDDVGGTERARAAGAGEGARDRWADRGGWTGRSARWTWATCSVTTRKCVLAVATAELSGAAGRGDRRRQTACCTSGT